MSDRFTNAPGRSRLGAALLATVVALQAGCAGHHRKTDQPEPPRQAKVQRTQPPPDVGRVAVVAVAEMPQTLSANPRPVASHAAPRPGRDAFRSCSEVLGGGGCGPDLAICAAIIVAELTICGAYGATVGLAHPAATTDFVPLPVLPLPATVDASLVQDALRREVVAAAQASGVKLATPTAAAVETVTNTRDYTPLAAQGVDTVLEVTLTQLVAEQYPEMADPPLPLDMQARARLVRTRDNAEISSNEYFYRGKTYDYYAWTENNGERLLKAVKNGYESLGHDISDSMFLLYRYPERKPQGETRSCGLAPSGPENDAVRTLAPVLFWQAFPREPDIAAAPEDMKRLTNVRYDLIIGSGNNGESPDIIYRREGLRGATHKVEMELKPDTRYFWSVRARFTLDGRERVTEWATHCPFEWQLVVGPRLYSFYTPKAADAPNPTPSARSQRAD